MKKKPSGKKLNRQDSSFDDLNNQLGSFGLEPPKRYRQSERVSQPQKEEKNQPSSKPQKRKPAPKAKKRNVELNNQEKMAVHKKKRKLKKKVRNALMMFGVVVAIILAIAVLCLTVLFKVDTIKVNGNKKYTTQQITAVLPVQKDDNLFLIKSNSVKEKLCTNLPYVYDVEISRKIPSTVEVKIIEPKNIYYVKNNDKTYTYIDNNFKVLETGTKKKIPDSIYIQKLALNNQVAGQVAKVNNKKALKDITNIMNVVSDLKIKKITSIYSENAGSNYLVYDNRITIKIGDTKDIEDKIYSALTAIDKLESTNPEAEGTLTSMGGKRVYFTETK